ncbi:hypothetical protein BC943DRAFT_306363 [Umbelopsis sp. AD052]|nr:hypothetical protein BC943DRAFT_306363 [Umbelopsis sp. AD052]
MSTRQTKSTQDRHERILIELIKQPGNNVCVDCRAKNPRWASHNLGVFLCIRCGGLHRRMGTHISKVKSVTMDSWTIEQIENIKANGGNDAVNRIYNPHPERHPLPLADDDHGMERYIRNKWEKKSFMDAPPQPASAASAIIRPGANIPQRSSSVPQLQRESDMNQGLTSLREMGFRDDEKNRRVLQQTNGKLEPAVEILSKLPGQQPITMQRKDQMTEQQMLSKLWGLGYKDESKCRDALRRTGGNLDVAIEILAKESRAGAVTPPVPPKNNAPQSLIDVSENRVNIAPANMNPYQQQVQQMPMQQMPMQQLQMQQPQVQTTTNPFGTSIIAAQNTGMNMVQNNSMPSQNGYPYGINQAQPQLQPQLTGFNPSPMNQYQPIQQTTFTSNPFTQMASSASTPTNSFGGVNPFNSQPMTPNGFAYNQQVPSGPQMSAMNQPQGMPVRSFTSPDFNQPNHYFARSNSAHEFQPSSGISQGQNPFF